METHGSLSANTAAFLDSLVQRIGKMQGDVREGQYFLQRLSLSLQRGNATSLFGSLGSLAGEGLPVGGVL